MIATAFEQIEFESLEWSWYAAEEPPSYSGDCVEGGYARTGAVAGTFCSIGATSGVFALHGAVAGSYVADNAVDGLNARSGR